MGALLFDGYAAGVRLETHEQKTMIMQTKTGIEKITIIAIEPTLRPEPFYSGVMQLFGKVTL